MGVTLKYADSGMVLHLPDKSFFDWCQEHYGINRGVYNVIDHWFFLKGHTNVESRRKTMILFLNSLIQSHTERKPIKFGKGGVKKSLDYFLVNQRNLFS
jgi:hypothetical protein